MSFLKKCNANNLQPASRNKRQPPFSPAGQAHRAGSSEISPDRSWAGRLTFVEDFTREHSLPDSRIASIEIAGIF